MAGRERCISKSFADLDLISKAACHYLMGMDDRFNILARYSGWVSSEVNELDCSWNLFLDKNQQLRVLIVRPFVNYV